MPWAATISNRGFLLVKQPGAWAPAGVVVVLAPNGVSELFWMPVFIYASLS